MIKCHSSAKKRFCYSTLGPIFCCVRRHRPTAIFFFSVVNALYKLHCLYCTGVDFQTKTLEVGGRVIALQLWDTAGQERSALGL